MLSVFSPNTQLSFFYVEKEEFDILLKKEYVNNQDSFLSKNDVFNQINQRYLKDSDDESEDDYDDEFDEEYYYESTKNFCNLFNFIENEFHLQLSDDYIVVEFDDIMDEDIELELNEVRTIYEESNLEIPETICAKIICPTIFSGQKSIFFSFFRFQQNNKQLDNKEKNNNIISDNKIKKYNSLLKKDDMYCFSFDFLNSFLKHNGSFYDLYYYKGLYYLKTNDNFVLEYCNCIIPYNSASYKDVLKEGIHINNIKKFMNDFLKI